MWEDAYLEAQYEERYELPDYRDEGEPFGGIDPFALADWPSRFTSEDECEIAPEECGDADCCSPVHEL